MDLASNLAMDLSSRLQSCSDYVHALEEERKKIQVFQRELPLCLQLVTQAIEGVRKQIGGSATMSEDGPVLEEFLPLNPSSSSSSDRWADGDAKKSAPAATGSGKKPDWLRSVQLWNQDADTATKVETPTKPIAVNAKRINGGAFHPFEREKHVAAPVAATAAACSTASGGGGAGAGAGADGGEEKKEGQSQPHRKARRCWSLELHHSFLRALEQLGGSHVATPKQIRELMKVDGLSNDEVKSHLQKYRLHNKRQGPAVQSSSSNNSSPVPQFVVVGGIWVPPPDYAAAVAATAQSADGPRAPAGGVYAPVASLLSDLRFQQQQQQKTKKQSHRSPTGPLARCSGENDGPGDDDDGATNCNASPTTSSSSQTTTASPHSRRS